LHLTMNADWCVILSRSSSTWMTYIHFTPDPGRFGLLKNHPHSSGPIYWAINDLPREDRYLQVNVICTSALPGPKEPDQQQLNNCLEPGVKEMAQLKNGTLIFSAVARTLHSDILTGRYQTGNTVILLYKCALSRAKHCYINCCNYRWVSNLKSDAHGHMAAFFLKQSFREIPNVRLASTCNFHSQYIYFPGSNEKDNMKQAPPNLISPPYLNPNQTKK
jgi:hypothetical protein